ncbi:MAG: hypothetical protein IPL92_00305 [Saprospiraceae bacterium]|nr:hypothetical protein [Candidatus Opimibacter iunctus]
MKLLFYVISGLLLFPGTFRAQDQDIQAYLDAYIGENAIPYLQPLADLFASNINTGVWEWSKGDSTFYFRLKAQAIVSFPSDPMQTFTGKTTGDFRPSQTATVPTIIGDRNAVLLQGEDTTFYIFPGGYDLKRLMLGTPQVTIGGFLHSEISGRFLSFSLGEDLPGIFYQIILTFLLNFQWAISTTISRQVITSTATSNWFPYTSANQENIFQGN